jgi:hypothetical protein
LDPYWLLVGTPTTAKRLMVVGGNTNNGKMALVVGGNTNNGKKVDPLKGTSFCKTTGSPL